MFRIIFILFIDGITQYLHVVVDAAFFLFHWAKGTKYVSILYTFLFVFFQIFIRHDDFLSTLPFVRWLPYLLFHICQLDLYASFMFFLWFVVMGMFLPICSFAFFFVFLTLFFFFFQCVFLFQFFKWFFCDVVFGFTLVIHKFGFLLSFNN